MQYFLLEAQSKSYWVSRGTEEGLNPLYTGLEWGLILVPEWGKVLLWIIMRQLLNFITKCIILIIFYFILINLIFLSYLILLTFITNLILLNSNSLKIFIAASFAHYSVCVLPYKKHYSMFYDLPKYFIYLTLCAEPISTFMSTYFSFGIYCIIFYNTSFLF